MSDITWEWDGRMEGFREHMAIDGSLKGVSGRGAALECTVVQLDHDKEEEPWHGRVGCEEKDLKSRVMGLHHITCKFDWFFHHPY